MPGEAAATVVNETNLPDWSARVSFANLDDHVYDDIGRAVRAVARSYRQAYEAAKAKPAARKAKRKRAASRRPK